MTVEQVRPTREDRALELHMEIWSADQWRGETEVQITEVVAWMQCGEAIANWSRSVDTELPTTRETIGRIEEALIEECRQWARTFDKAAYNARIAGEQEEEEDGWGKRVP